MSRPKSNKKGRTPPMPDRPPPMSRLLEYGAVVNACNHSEDSNEHEEDCNGLCERRALVETEVDLHNEVVKWNLLGVKIQGIPACLMGHVPFQGVGVEILETDFRLRSLLDLLLEKGVIVEDELDDVFRKTKADSLKMLRERAERAKAAEDLAVAKTKLYGPNGEVLH